MAKETRKHNIVPLKDLNLTNRFLFDEVMEDPQTQQDALSIILSREVSLLQRSETEKELRISPLIRSVRMDVFSMDEEQTVYNTEMQSSRKTDLEKRSRYYQALLDTSLLEPGIPNYSLLNQSYLIMIMTFDLFGYGKYRYTFQPVCQEVPGCVLEDGTVRIFLNTKGKNDDEVSGELAEFLHYLEQTTDENAKSMGSDRIRRIHERVQKVKSSEKVGVKYMQAWEERYYDMQEAREEGIKEGIKEGIEEGIKEGRKKGQIEGEHEKLKKQIMKKLQKNKTEEQIAEELEESLETVQAIITEITGINQNSICEKHQKMIDFPSDK